MKQRCFFLAMMLGFTFALAQNSQDIVMPDSKTLEKNLTNARLNYLIEYTNIVSNLANKTLSPIEIANQIDQTFNGFRKELNQQEISPKLKSMLLGLAVVDRASAYKALLGDHLGTLRNLESQGRCKPNVFSNSKL